MGGFTRTVGAASIVLWPVCFGIADEMQLVAVGNDNQVGLTSGWAEQQAVAQTASVTAHLGLFQAASWLFLVAALLTVPAALAIWSLTASRSPAWAWSAAALALLGVMGQLVNVVWHFGLQQAYATGFDPSMGFKLDQQLESLLFIDVMFTAFFLVFLAPIIQVIGLRRAKIAPLWAIAAVVVAGVAAVILGSSTWTSALIPLLWIAGFTPAARAMLRNTHSAQSGQPQPPVRSAVTG